MLMTSYYRVMVMSKGEIIEFGAPQELLENKASTFHAMAKDAGLTS